MPSLEFYQALAEANEAANREWEVEKTWGLNEYGERTSPEAYRELEIALGEAQAASQPLESSDDDEGEFDEYGERRGEDIVEATSSPVETVIEETDSIVSQDDDEYEYEADEAEEDDDDETPVSTSSETRYDEYGDAEEGVSLSEAVEDETDRLFNSMPEGGGDDDDEGDDEFEIGGIAKIVWSSAPVDAQWEGWYESKEDVKNVAAEIDVAKEYFVVGEHMDEDGKTRYHLWRLDKDMY
jgi:hypothetical protein